MSSEEVLARLNPGSGDLEATSAATGDKITPADVAHAVGLVGDRIGVLLLLIRVADHWRYLDDLEAHVLTHVRERASQEDWRTRPPRTLSSLLRMMVRLAVFEHCIPRRCRSCKGRGQRFPADGPARTCENCKGTGRRAQMSGRSRAEQIEIDPKAWRNTWSDRYAWIQRMLAEHDNTAVEQLRRVMRSGDA